MVLTLRSLRKEVIDMDLRIRIFILMLIPVIVMTHTSIAVAAMFASATAPTKVTIYQPETIESEPIKVSGESGSSWWKWTLGVLISGGIAAYVSKPKPGPTTGDTGTLVGTW